MKDSRIHLYACEVRAPHLEIGAAHIGTKVSPSILLQTQTSLASDPSGSKATSPAACEWAPSHHPDHKQQQAAAAVKETLLHCSSRADSKEKTSAKDWISSPGSSAEGGELQLQNDNYVMILFIT